MSKKADYFSSLSNSNFWQSAAKGQTYVYLSHYINDIYDIYNRNITFTYNFSNYNHISYYLFHI